MSHAYPWMNVGLETTTPGQSPAHRREARNWRVGLVAHDPLRGRCPRAAPNPLFTNYGRSVFGSMGRKSQKSKYWGFGTGNF